MNRSNSKLAPKLQLGLMAQVFDISKTCSGGLSIEFKSPKAFEEFAFEHSPRPHWIAFEELATALGVKTTVFISGRKSGHFESCDTTLIPVDLIPPELLQKLTEEPQ